MTSKKKIPIKHWSEKALNRLNGRTLVRQASHTDEAITRGGGYTYYTLEDGKRYPTATARKLIADGYVEPKNDGLIPEVSQTYTKKSVIA